MGVGVLGLDNVNDYYPVALKRARLAKLEALGVYTVEADLNDRGVLRKALDACAFTHVLHLAAQAGVRYAVKNPGVGRRELNSVTDVFRFDPRGFAFERLLSGFNKCICQFKPNVKTKLVPPTHRRTCTPTWRAW